MEDRKRIIFAAAALGIILIALGAFLYWKFAYMPGKKAVIHKKVVAKEAAKKKELPAIQKKFSNPKIAIVMDDFGYNMSDLNKLFA